MRGSTHYLWNHRICELPHASNCLSKFQTNYTMKENNHSNKDAKTFQNIYRRHNQEFNFIYQILRTGEPEGRKQIKNDKRSIKFSSHELFQQFKVDHNFCFLHFSNHCSLTSIHQILYLKKLNDNYRQGNCPLLADEFSDFSNDSRASR